MEKYYYQNQEKIYKLIKSGDDETLYRDYPKIKIYRKFLDLIIEVYHEVYSYDYEDYFITQVFSGSLMISEKIYTHTKDMINNKELVSHIVNAYHKNFFDSLLLLIFNPVVYNKHSEEGTYYMSVLFKTLNLDEKIVIHDEKYTTLFEKIRLIREEYKDLYYDTTKYVLLLYCHMNNNYEYLDNYLSDYTHYRDKLIMNNIIEEEDYLLSYPTRKVFQKTKELFSKENRIIE